MSSGATTSPPVTGASQNALAFSRSPSTLAAMDAEEVQGVIVVGFATEVTAGVSALRGVLAEGGGIGRCFRATAAASQLKETISLIACPYRFCWRPLSIRFRPGITRARDSPQVLCQSFPPSRPAIAPTPIRTIFVQVSIKLLA